MFSSCTENCKYDQDLRRQLYKECMEQSINKDDNHIERSRVIESCLEVASKLHFVCEDIKDRY